ncbi:MAG TPA: prepilin-type N-terminal cleavage/methylation domain-containing protein [Candidatus Paceibacterota bacterium]|nr:prepilin-type N-terminal cleavage/methylation domain-containing protein [Candidatus Paceibacterota bacterium]
MRIGGTQSGFTLLEVLIGLAIFATVSVAIFFSYGNVAEIIQSAQYNSAAVSLIESNVESVRNMRYEDVGTVGGIPAGKIPQVQTVTLDNTPFQLHAYVRNIDDPFDGTAGGTPNDTTPADYKLVEFQVTCDSCARYKVISLATLVAPKNLESTSKNGNLFIRVLDASGNPLQGVTVHVTDPSAKPAIDLTDITNNIGQLQLVGAATGSAAYHIVVSEPGYTTDQTYPPGNPANPVKPDVTVATQQLTITTLSIDKVSSVVVNAHDRFCAPVPNMAFALTGTKLIGTQPDVPKYSQNLATGADGSWSNNAIEWDTYTLRPTDPTWDIGGVPSSLSFSVNPGGAVGYTWEAERKSGNALSVSVMDAYGNPLNGATVHVTATGYDQTAVSGRSTFGNLTTPWALTPLPDGTYASAAQEFDSPTFDLGNSSTSFTTFGWTPASQDPRTGTGSVQFQIAANNDDATWNFIDPSGLAGLSGKRYFRYRAFLQTADPRVSPMVNTVSIGFSSGCLVPGAAYLNAIPSGTATLNVSLPGYQPYSGSVTVDSSWQRIPITLSP